jgi:hypothetical protein
MAEFFEEDPVSISKSMIYCGQNVGLDTVVEEEEVEFSGDSTENRDLCYAARNSLELTRAPSVITVERDNNGLIPRSVVFKVTVETESYRCNDS